MSNGSTWRGWSTETLWKVATAVVVTFYFGEGKIREWVHLDLSSKEAREIIREEVRGAIIEGQTELRLRVGNLENDLKVHKERRYHRDFPEYLTNYLRSYHEEKSR